MKYRGAHLFISSTPSSFRTLTLKFQTAGLITCIIKPQLTEMWHISFYYFYFTLFYSLLLSSENCRTGEEHAYGSKVRKTKQRSHSAAFLNLQIRVFFLFLFSFFIFSLVEHKFSQVSLQRKTRLISPLELNCRPVPLCRFSHKPLSSSCGCVTFELFITNAEKHPLTIEVSRLGKYFK